MSSPGSALQPRFVAISACVALGAFTSLYAATALAYDPPKTFKPFHVLPNTPTQPPDRDLVPDTPKIESIEPDRIEPKLTEPEELKPIAPTIQPQIRGQRSR
jgi:hypothetical protein